MARRADIVAIPKESCVKIRYFSGESINEMPNREYLDFTGNCTVNDDGQGILVTIPDVPAGSVTVGNVITLPAGSMAYVENVGTPIHAILNFGIPRGDSADEEIADLRQRVINLENALSALELTVEANDAAAVHIAGEETITGAKTFTGDIDVPLAETDDDSNAAASTAWGNDKLDAIYYWDRGNDTDTDTTTDSDTDTTSEG